MGLSSLARESLSSDSRGTSQEPLLPLIRPPRLPLFPGGPESQHVDGLSLNFVVHLVLPDLHPPDLALAELGHLLAEARVGEQHGRSFDERLY